MEELDYNLVFRSRGTSVNGTASAPPRVLRHLSFQQALAILAVHGGIPERIIHVQVHKAP